MKVEIEPSEVIEAVKDYMAKSNIHLANLTLRTVKRDGEDAIVAEGAVEVHRADINLGRTREEDSARVTA